MISSRLPTDMGVPLRSSTFVINFWLILICAWVEVYLAPFLFVFLLLGLQPLLVPDELFLHQQVVLDALLLQKPQATLKNIKLIQEDGHFFKQEGEIFRCVELWPTLVWGVTPGNLLAASGPFTLFLFLPTLEKQDQIFNSTEGKSKCRTWLAPEAHTSSFPYSPLCPGH